MSDDSGRANSVPSARIVCDDTACIWCNQGPSQGKKLKRCRGCNIAVYCGKECQVAAWPTHKRLCRSRNAQDGGCAGYPTFLALARAVQDWSQIHKYSMAVLAHAAIRRTRGVAATLRLGRMVAFVLEPRRAEDASADITLPEEFRVIGVSTQGGEGVRPFREISENIKKGIDGGFCGELSNREPAGCVPVLYVVKGKETPTVSSLYSVYLPCHHPDVAANKEEVAFLDDIGRVFMHFVNNGNVIKPPVDGRGGILPPSGILVQTKKGEWTWHADVGETAWQEMDRLMPQQAILFKTNRPATELWRRFQQW